MISQSSAIEIIYDSYFKARETIDKENEDSLKWITDVIENPNRDKKERCEICGSCRSKENLQEHHIRGRKQGNEVITVCEECHDVLSRKQMLWDRSWLDPNYDNKDVFLKRGLIDVFHLKYEKTGQEIYKAISEKLEEGFSYG